MKKQINCSLQETSDTEEYDYSNIDVTDLIGKCDKWQKILISIILYIGIYSAISNLNLPFLVPKIDHWCANPFRNKNISIEEWKNYSIPTEIKNGKVVYSNCKMYTERSTENITEYRKIVECSSWEYDHSFYRSTVTEEWDLVCKNSWLASFTGSAYFLGYLLSSFISGQLSDRNARRYPDKFKDYLRMSKETFDILLKIVEPLLSGPGTNYTERISAEQQLVITIRFGRRRVLFVCIFIQCIFGIVSVFAPYYWIFAASYFLLSVGRTGIFITSFVLVVEAVGLEYRSTIGMFNKFGWGFGQIILSGIAWFFRDWIYIQLWTAFPVMILLAFWNFILESPRWLISRGKLNEAEVVLQKIMKINGKDTKNLRSFIRILSLKIQREDASNQQISFIDLLKHNQLRKITFILYIIWIVSIFAFYGISFNAEDLGGSLHLTYILFGLMDFPAGIITPVSFEKIGRRYSIAALMILNGMFCLITIAVPNYLTWLRITLVVGSKFCVSTTIIMLYVYSSEIYPTVVRNVGVGSCSMVARIGAIAAPFMKQASQSVHWILPFIIFGVLSAFAGSMVLLLPETRNTHLSNNITTAKRDKKSEVLELIPVNTNKVVNFKESV